MNYASNYFENKDATHERILLFIKTKGPISTADLARALEMTPEAARQQVQKLLVAGLIAGRQEAASGVGRPRQRWVLTEAGYARFPDTHAQLTVQLLDTVRHIFGEDGLERLISQREEESRAVYLQACSNQGLPERLHSLAEIRTAEGYMARVEQDGKDWLLIEDHCPICAAARTCQGFCRSELRLFQEIIGDEASVTREQHLLADAGRCVYRIAAK